MFDRISHNITLPYVLDKEDFYYIQKAVAAEKNFHQTNFITVNNVTRLPQNQSQKDFSASESKKLFRDIINNGIDDEDIFYLKECFDTLKSLKGYCLACNVLNLSPITSAESINRQAILEGNHKKPIISNYNATKPTKREETITKSTATEDVSQTLTTPVDNLFRTNTSDHTTSKQTNPAYVATKPSDPGHVFIEDTVSKETNKAQTKLDEIISTLNDPEKYFANFKYLLNEESCWFHRLSWTPHPSTSEIPESMINCITPNSTPSGTPQSKVEHKEIRRPSGKGQCARSKGYSKDDIALLKEKQTKPIDINEIGYSSSKKKRIANNKELLKKRLLSKLAEKKKKKEQSRLLKELNLPYTKTYKRRKLRMSKDMWNEQRRMCSAGKFGSNLFSINHLKYLNSKLMLGKSKIHGSGVFAVEPIGMHDIIIEYVGEVIRPIIADLREKKYKQSYIFSIDEQKVVDATNFGNISRFINHSCKPNSYAKLLVYNNQKKIVIYAKRNINAGEEITYDYKMKTDGEEKVECFCKAPGCKGTLN